MNILWMSWKDAHHPQAGGAETVQDEICKRLVAKSHSVTLLTAAYRGAAPIEEHKNYRVIRRGNRVSVYYYAWLYYRKHLRGWADIVIDEINTVPFFAAFYVRERHVAFVHQLCREIWFYELPWFIGWVGYLIEPFYIWMLSGQLAITVSKSTAEDLKLYGFKPRNISIISEGLTIDPIRSLPRSQKYSDPTLLIHGSMRSMKRALDAVRAFEIAKQYIPELKLKISGSSSGAYGEKVLSYIKTSDYGEDIDYLGRITDAKKTELMRKCHVLLAASVREGWGLIVTEANSQGTPAVVYDVPGLRDSVRANETGIITRRNPNSMAEGIVDILSCQAVYECFQKNAYQWSKNITFDHCYKDFITAIGE